ncbi:MAG TPA: DUF4166 domain-containing protein [Hyphomonadaceae bacterium]|nr:DUF4166 domain-containing protein [Hyphomonadaceae bacterium]
MSRPRVIVVGGAGVFGSRLVRGLLAATDAEVLVAGRDRAKAKATAKETGSAGAIVLDRLRATPADISGANLVIDAAGPFQGADLSFAWAAIAAGADYLDLSDARDFVVAFPSLDAEAKAKGVRAFTGASSTPALSHAALDEITAGWRRIDRLRVGISPANQTPRGRSVIEAALSWAGGPLRVFEGGQWRERPGWSKGSSHVLPGLGRRRFRLAETPDHDLLVQRYHPTDEALMTFGQELNLIHFGLAGLSWLRRLGVVRDLRFLASPLHAMSEMLLPFGTDAGGMFVEAWGRDADDRPTRAEWTLVIGDRIGPYVPTIPALAMARRLLSGEAILAGAAPCVGILRLSDMQPDFERHGMVTQATTEALPGPFDMALGLAFETLPAAVKTSHRAGPVAHFKGTAKVDGATGLARLPAAIFGLPHAADAAPVHVEKRTTAPGAEIWKRTIGGARFQSEISYKAPGLVSERFGPFTFTLALTAGSDGHIMRITGWRIGPLPLPVFLAPKSLATESQTTAGRFAFDVPISAPLLGRLTRYRGELDQTQADSA